MIGNPTASVPPGILVRPDCAVRLTYEGKAIPALAGQSIAAALYASGVRVFSRGPRHQRPRGLFCLSGDCANCLMQVDGKPNVRTCIEPVREGQVVAPNLGQAQGIFGKVLKLGRFFGSSKAAAPPETHPADLPATEIEQRETEVCVIGGGPAGLAAALEAASAGASVLLLDRQPRLGGHLLFDGVELPEIEPDIEALCALPRVQILSATTAFELQQGNVLGAVQGNRLLWIRAKQIIICTGGRERPYVFHNNDLPGIFLCRGVQRLARLYGVLAGRKAVVLTDSDEGGRMAEELMSFGIDIVAVVDPRPSTYGSHVGRGWHSQSVIAGKAMVGAAEGPAWSMMTSSIILAARGSSHLTGVSVAQLNPTGTITEKSHKELECDLLCIASSLVPNNDLLLQGGVRLEHKEGRWLPANVVPGLSAAGAAAGTFDLAYQVLEGKLRGALAAGALGYKANSLDHQRRDWEAWLETPAPKGSGNLMPYLDSTALDRYVCLCEDVLEGELELALVDGYRQLETLRSYTRATLGPCQGRMCQSACMEICARGTGQDPDSAGPTLCRRPAVPVELTVLAAPQPPSSDNA